MPAECLNIFHHFLMATESAGLSLIGSLHLLSAEITNVVKCQKIMLQGGGNDLSLKFPTIKSTILQIVNVLLWLHVANVNGIKKGEKNNISTEDIDKNKDKASTCFKGSCRVCYSAAGEKEKGLCERHPLNQSNHSQRVSNLHWAQTSCDRRHCLLWLEPQAAGLSVCYSVNNVNNFPMSSELAHLVGFVSNYKQDACGCVVFTVHWRGNVLCKSLIQHRAQDKLWLFRFKEKKGM